MAENLTRFSIQQMSLLTDVAAENSAALRISWPETPFNPMSKLRIHDVEISGSRFDPTMSPEADGGPYNPPTWWRSGIVVINSGGLDIGHVTILGNRMASSSALHCDGLNAGSFRHFVSNLFVRWFDVGLDWIGNLEGLYMTNFEVVECRIGVRASGPENGSGSVWSLSNGHMDCREICAQFDHHTIIKLANIAFFHTGGVPPKLAGNMLQFSHCQWVTITGCSLLGFNDGTLAQNGIATNNCKEVLVSENHIDLIQNYGVVFGPNTSMAHSINNRMTALGSGTSINQGSEHNTTTDFGE